MKVGHVCFAGKSGGRRRPSATGCLRREDIESYFFCDIRDFYENANSLLKNLQALKFSFIKGINSVLKRVFIRGDRPFSLSVLSIDIAPLLKTRELDVVYIHWLGRGFSFSSTESAATKVFFIHRDYQFLSGGCHYPLGCGNFLRETGCQECPEVRFGLNQLLRKGYRKASEGASNGFIGTSMMAECGALLDDAFLVGNVVELPENYQCTKFPLPPDQSLWRIAFGASNIFAREKGFDILLDALEKYLDNEKFELHLFGSLGTRNHSLENNNYRIVRHGPLTQMRVFDVRAS